MILIKHVNQIRKLNTKIIGNHKGITRAMSSTMNSINNDRSSAFNEEVAYFARKKQVGVNMKTLLDTGLGRNIKKETNFSKSQRSVDGTTPLQQVLIQVACFLHRELPVRLAHRAIELESTLSLHDSKHVKQVISWYKQSFKELRECPIPMDITKEKQFATIISNIYERHSRTLINMAKGAHDVRTALGFDIQDFAKHIDVQKNLDEFYLSRIGIRILIGQYLALRDENNSDEVIGLVSRNTSPYEVALQAISDASYMCTRQHGDAPEVTVVGRTDLTFPYVPSHIHYMLVELLKNSMRATVEHHGVDDMPPIKIVIADDEKNEDVAIKVSDEGGGIPRSNMKNVWSYLFTTADPNILEGMLDEDSSDFSVDSPLAGLGYGLPIARNYARYFGGELTLMSMEGYGTDSYIYLNRLGNKVVQL